VLKITVNQIENRVSFSGDTFNSKDRIKQLGRARWNPVHKTWELELSAVKVDELAELFPGAVLEREGEGPVTLESDPETVKSAVIETSNLSTEIAPQKRIALPSASSVSELAASIRGVLSESFSATIYVKGVLNKVGPPKNGRCYLDLADEQARDVYLNCVVWSDFEGIFEPLSKLGIQLERDLQVMLGVKVGLNTKDGRVSLSVVSVVPEFTLGKLTAERDATNQRLKAEEIFSRNQSLLLPLLPRRLGILTSPQGTVIHDFLASLEVSQFGFELFFLPVQVQGREAKHSVIRGLQQLSGMKLDAILLFRGGGSPAELAVFNDYELARAICLCPVPVLAAIGHQEDQSSAQDVAAKAFGVPKDVGAYFANVILDLRTKIKLSMERLAVSAERILSARERDFANQCQRISRESSRLVELREQEIINFQQLPSRAWNFLESQLLIIREIENRVLLRAQLFCRDSREKLEHALRDIRSRTESLIVRAEQRLGIFPELTRQALHLTELRQTRLESLEELVQGARPETQLQRGFALVRKSSGGEVVVSGASLAVGERVQVQFRDLAHEVTVGEILEENQKE